MIKWEYVVVGRMSNWEQAVQNRHRIIKWEYNEMGGKGQNLS